MHKPITTKHCANIDCRSYGVVYPSDDVFYPTNSDGFWACCEACQTKANRLPKSLKALAVKQAQTNINTARRILGL